MSIFIDFLFPRNYLKLGSILPTKSVIQVDGFEGVLPLFAYTGQIRDLVHDLKFNFVSDTVPTIVNLIDKEIKSNYPNILQYWQTNNFVLVPVPIHPFRQNYRGFNQSELIVSSLTSSLNLTASSSLVVRSRFSSAQSSKARSSRSSNISHSFTLSGSPPANIILFDDVYTTGSTLKSLRSVFPKECNVWGLTLAG